MKKIILTISLSIVLICFVKGFANEPSPMGQLTAYVVCSDSPRYIKKWVTTPYEKDQRIRKVNVFAPGEASYTAVIVTGYTIGQDGSVDLEAGFEFTKPEGKVIFSEEKYSKANSSGHSKFGFVMLYSALDLGFDNTDSIGEYELKFYVKDLLAGKATTASQKITLTLEKYNKSVLTSPISDAKVLDDLWGYYRTSKDSKAVERIISVLHLNEDGYGMEIVVGGAARWSLANNAFRDEKVYLMCKRQLSQGDKKNRKMLKEIIAKVDHAKKTNSSQ